MTNPLLTRSDLPYGMPDFANITDADYPEAFTTAMADQLAALESIATSTQQACVANIIEPWEASGENLRRALNTFFTLKSSDTNDVRDAIEEEFAPKFAAFNDAVLLNRGLYDRLVALEDLVQSGEAVLDGEDSWWLSEKLREFRRSGINLDDAKQVRLRALNAEIATLESKFSQILVAGRNAAGVHITDEAELAGLSPADREAARGAAERRGVEGWVLELVNTTDQPLLASLADRSVREQLFTASVTRGLGGEFDTTEIIVKLARLRSERATLLGFAHHAEYAATDGCAKSTENVTAILGRVGPASVANARRESEALQARLTEREPGATLEPWDWAFLAEAERSARFQLDDAVLRPYLDFERVLHEGVFAAATALYGITFTRVEGLAGYTDECRVYEVNDADGSSLAAVVVDPYARPSKQGGAWMTNLIDQSHLLADRPIVTNNCNVTRPGPGQPALMSWDNVITLFHEFGHDLHGILADTRYPTRSGTETPRDFVEFPSQVNEMWAWDPAMIARYASHHETGEPIDPAWIQTLLAARHFNEGFHATEAFAAMILDQVWHSTPLDELPTSGSEVAAFEARALQATGMDFPLVPPRYRTSYFSHIWGGGYSAGYYSYLWSEVMDADTVAWFVQNGGLTRENGDRFRQHLLAPGGSVDVMASYRDFRGADPDVAHLLARRGLA